MASFGLGRNIRAVPLISSIAYTTGNVDTATGIDLAGAESVAVVVNLGVTAEDAAPTLEFYEGDANDFTIAAGTKLADHQVLNEPDMDDTDNQAYVFDIKPDKRYLKIRFSDPGNENTVVSVIAILGNLAEVPAN